MVLVHTEEELLATAEPAMCVISGFCYDTIDTHSKEPCKVYVRAVRVNEHFVKEDERLFDESIAEPNIFKADSEYSLFIEEKARLLFGEGHEINWTSIPSGEVIWTKVY